MKPVSARLPVSSISRSSPTRSSISAHSAAVRWSFQRIAGRSTWSRSSSVTRPCIWPEKPIDAGSTSRSASAASVARHQSSGSCSAQPGLRDRERVLALGATDDLALGRQRERLDAARADVDPDERGHSSGSSVSSTRFPNGSRHMKRGRPTISVGVARLDSGRFDPGAELVEAGVDGETEVRVRRRLVARPHQVQLEVAADAEPDELVRVELRRDGPLLQAEQLAVERPGAVGAVRGDRDGDVLQPHAHYPMRPSRRRRARRPAPRPSRAVPHAAPRRRSATRCRR